MQWPDQIMSFHANKRLHYNINSQTCIHICMIKLFTIKIQIEIFHEVMNLNCRLLQIKIAIIKLQMTWTARHLIFLCSHDLAWTVSRHRVINKETAFEVVSFGVRFVQFFIWWDKKMAMFKKKIQRLMWLWSLYMSGWTRIPATKLLYLKQYCEGLLYENMAKA